MPFRDFWLVLGGIIVLAGFGAGQPVIAGVGFVIVVIGGVTRFWHRHLWDRVSIRFETGEERVFIDEPISLRVEMENRKILPLPWFEWRLTLADQMSMDGEPLIAQQVPGSSWLVRKGAMGWYERQEWQFTMRAATRGFMRVGPVSVSSSDILGVFPSQRNFEQVGHIIVFPRIFSMRDLGMPADRPFGDRKGRDRLFEDPLRISGLREYRPGDTMRRIDWKATARHGELRSRLYEPSATRMLYIMANLDTLEHSWEGYLPDELERLVSVAASVASWAATERYAVGLLANGAYPNADRPIRMPPSGSKDQLTRILEALAVVQPLTMGNLAGAIRRESGRLPLGSTIVLVASLLPEPLADTMTRLAEEGYHAAIVATSDRVAAEEVPGVQVYHVARAFEPVESIEPAEVTA